MKTNTPLQWRAATGADCPILAELNHQLIRDEGHRNKMNVAQLEERMRGWLHTGEYAAIVFEQAGTLVAYALYRESPEEIYLRQFFVARPRRREGIGRAATEILLRQLWPANKRLLVEVLAQNVAGIAFYRAVGFRDYSVALEVMPQP